MPHGKRGKDTVLSQVKKQTKDQKKDLVQNVRAFINEYKDIYVLYYSNESSSALQNLRAVLTDSKLSFASNNILQLVVGRDQETTLQPKTYLLSKLIKGKCSLLFTNLNLEDVKLKLSQCNQVAYVQGGQIAPKTIIIPQGYLEKSLYAGSIEPELRRLGLPSKLDNEVILVTEEYTLCKEGDVLTGAQTALLRHFGHQLAQFQIEPICGWFKEDQDILLMKDQYAELLD